MSLIEHIKEAMRLYGWTRARELRAAAATMTDTEIIDQEDFVPEWVPGPWAKNAPVQHNGQVYRTLQAHDSTQTPDWTPETQPALFGLCHTKNPAKAKPWVQPLGISGMYYKGECYVDTTGVTHRQTFDGGNVYDAAAMPSYWETVEV